MSKYRTPSEARFHIVNHMRFIEGTTRPERLVEIVTTEVAAQRRYHRELAHSLGTSLYGLYSPNQDTLQTGSVPAVKPRCFSVSD